MKVAVTAQGEKLDAPVDPRFGRAACFIVYDMGTGAWEPMPNEQNVNAAQGAGIQAARHVSDLGVAAVITGNCGPKAFATLAAAEIAVFTGAEGTVAEAIEAFKTGHLQKLGGASVEAHYGSI